MNWSEYCWMHQSCDAMQGCISHDTDGLKGLTMEGLYWGSTVKAEHKLLGYRQGIRKGTLT